MTKDLSQDDRIRVLERRLTKSENKRHALRLRIDELEERVNQMFAGMGSEAQKRMQEGPFGTKEEEQHA